MAKIAQYRCMTIQRRLKQENIIDGPWSLPSQYKINHVKVFDWHMNEIIPKAKRSTHIPKIKIFQTSFLRYRKYIAYLSGYFGRTSRNPSKIKSINLQKTFNVYQHAKNQLCHSFLSGDTAKIFHTYFEYFRHAWSRPNMIVSTCR